METPLSFDECQFQNSMWQVTLLVCDDRSYAEYLRLSTCILYKINVDFDSSIGIERSISL